MGVDLAKVAGATAAVGVAAAAVSSLSSSGPATGLSATAGSNGGSGFFSKLLSGVKPPKVPIPNPLFKYASYTYEIGLGVLPDGHLLNPDKYMKGSVPLIFKSAGTSPLNRVKTPYGAFDFYINDLVMDCLPVLQSNSISNVTNFTFNVIEPYSMGMFLIALQTAAQKYAQQDNWLQAPFLLTIDFRGVTESGQMVNIPNTSRKIPIKLTNAAMTVDEKGCVYAMQAIPWGATAQSKADAGIKSDISISGTTVQEMLQTGEKSLQAVINAKLKQQKEKGIVPVPDEIVIIFPTDISSGGNSKKNDKTESSSSATTPVSIDAIAKQLKLTRTGAIGSDKNVNLVQADADCNIIGQSKLGFSDLRKGYQPVGKDKEIYNTVKDVNVRSNNVTDVTLSDFKFSQGTDIMNAINQVILNSDYVTKALEKGQIDNKGQRQWWNIDTQVYNRSTDENYAVTGMKPRVIVYRVIPYLVHTANKSAPNQLPIGMSELGAEIVKQYNYIYTGKNVDIIKFNIQFEFSQIGIMGQATLAQTQDERKAAESAGAKDKKEDNKSQPQPPGNKPSLLTGVLSTAQRWIEYVTGTDYNGGGGNENFATRAARSFHDAVTSPGDMVDLEMEIIGDPYYIIQSGSGPYTSAIQSQNLNQDGSMAHLNGEVHISVTFTTPVDINLSTGLYDFGKTKTAPVKPWTGYYRLTGITSKFKDGTFTQTLVGSRIPGQEQPKSNAATPDTTYNIQNKTEQKSSK